MPAIEVRPGIHWIGVNDRTTDLFEGLWPITKEGVSYNAYVVDGDEKALIDLAKGFKTDELLDENDLGEAIEEHREQVTRYRNALHELRKLDAKAYLCFLDYQGRVEWVNIA